MRIQVAFSTNWNAALDGSKSIHSSVDRMKTISEVDSAIDLALRATVSASPRAVMIKNTPTSGRKVTRVRSGQWIIAPSPRQQVPGDQRDHADQHRERIVIDVPGLQPAHLAGRRGNAVGAEPVDDRAVAGLP